MTDSRLDDAIAAYLSGKSVENAAKPLRFDANKLRRTLKERGLTRSPEESKRLARERSATTMARIAAERRAQFRDEIVSRYTAGESGKAIAGSLPGNLSRGFVVSVLEEAGIPVRGASDAERLKWQQMSPATRKNQVAAAHAAMRGRTLPFEEKCAQALGKEAKCPNQSGHERLMIDHLSALGLPVIPQKAIGPYNADIGAAPVAVEIYGGNFHAYGRHAARFPERCRYFADQGWALVVIWTYGLYNPLTIDAAKYVVAFLDEVKRDPSLIGKYRMIGGRGQLFAAGSLKANNLPTVLARCASLNGRTKYDSIAG